ncbi:L-aspartate oxidase [bacterium]|nr:L-aspartate oxidase [candidate division CSSED10-310 bacterium]
MDSMEDIRDVVVIGSGAAGLMYAVHVARNHRVEIYTKDTALESNTRYAQGGIAAVLNIEDSYEKHIQDTLTAGAGLCDIDAVHVLVREAPARIFDLINMGVYFDRTGESDLQFTREGGHSDRRILHVGDMTGQAIETSLLSAISKLQDRIRVYDHVMASELLVKNNTCFGVELVDPDGSIRRVLAKTVFLATGGAGQLFSETTNPDIATGDGYVMSYLAGAKLKNLEFIQFHPTVFHKRDAPRFLISESVRGEGGILFNTRGERFMPEYHKMAELAPRDIVSRAIIAEMKKTRSKTVFLSLEKLDQDFIEQRFPTILATLRRHGIDPVREPIPVAPAAHYMCGGVPTDIDGRTSIQGLYAGGEVACTGVHGANRLASNSLLESVVFAYRAAVNSDRFIRCLTNTWRDDLRNLDHGEPPGTPAATIPDEHRKSIRQKLRMIMWQHCGIIRSDTGLDEGMNFVKTLHSEFVKTGGLMDKSVPVLELRNLLLLAELVLKSARDRQINAGTHYNIDCDTQERGNMSNPD